MRQRVWLTGTLILVSREVGSRLRGTVTTVVIAHRRSRVRDADLVVVLADAGIRATGSFADVTRADPAFARAAKLQGLS
jgi:ABC-type multidrug transport system fused ATPase/permease subunit